MRLVDPENAQVADGWFAGAVGPSYAAHHIQRVKVTEKAHAEAMHLTSFIDLALLAQVRPAWVGERETGSGIWHRPGAAGAAGAGVGMSEPHGFWATTHDSCPRPGPWQAGPYVPGSGAVLERPGMVQSGTPPFLLRRPT